jgi:hypothetical protein
MTSEQIQPNRTYAIVVGIEQYAAGPDWNLDGPAHDARRFSDWLRDRGVPAEQIALFLAPLDANGALMNGNPAAQAATRELIDQALIDHMPQREGDLLYFFWGGHGVMTADGTRRLFYADASEHNMLNLDLNSLLTTMRSDTYAKLPRQICIVDTCANYIEEWGLNTTLPGTIFPRGQPLPPQQFALVAGRAGDRAKNLDVQQTGLFTREVLTELATAPADQWPPNMDQLASRVQTRFSSLRAQWATDQTPILFSYYDWAGNERSLGQPASGGGGAPAPAPIYRELDFTEKLDLARALLACQPMATAGSRANVLKQIRHEVRIRIDDNDNPLMYTVNIIETCMNFAGAMPELLKVVRGYGSTSNEVQRLDEVVGRLGL